MRASLTQPNPSAAPSTPLLSGPRLLPRLYDDEHSRKTMKLMFRPLQAFLGVLDLKTGVTLAVFFALFNKVAGFYGLVAAVTGAGGSFAQFSLYIYSTLASVVLLWGLKATSEEDPKRTLYFAHLFFADHVLSTAWTAFFAVTWWLYTPHDGRRTANSAPQEDLINIAHAAGHGHNMTDAERAVAAQAIWDAEKGYAGGTIIVGWLIKFYLAALVYSYAFHLRRGSYRALPCTRPSPLTAAQYAMLDGAMGAEEDDDDDVAGPVEDFYRLPQSAGGRRQVPPGWGLGKAGSPTTAMKAQEQGEVLFDEEEGGSRRRSGSR